VARYHSIRNFVADNKREAGTMFLNHLIDVGAVVMNGPIITAGPNFLRYVEYLDLGRFGYYNVHNARCGVEHHLGEGNFTFLQTGGPGRYICSLQFPIYGPSKTLLIYFLKKLFSNFICYLFSISDLLIEFTVLLKPGKKQEILPSSRLPMNYLPQE
jgi:hypothetical protein